MTDAAQRTASLSADQKKTVMELGYSGGTYTTINKTDICNEYITAAGATNVAADYSGATSGNALTVDAEQIAAWNPDVVICMSQEAKSAFMSDPALTQCKAVQNNTVYVIPTGTYLWSVRSGEGALMTPWLGTVVYPEQFSDVNMTTLVKDFFSTYYRYTLSDAEAATILAGSATVSAPK
jgi:iron complex transport system substrate-binding protein